MERLSKTKANVFIGDCSGITGATSRIIAGDMLRTCWHCVQVDAVIKISSYGRRSMSSPSRSSSRITHRFWISHESFCPSMHVCLAVLLIGESVSPALPFLAICSPASLWFSFYDGLTARAQSNIAYNEEIKISITITTINRTLTFY